MKEDHRSGCPINLTLEILGDRWSLIVIRDMMFGNRRHFRELLTQSEEGIASNILADRLKKLMERGLITRSDDPSHKQKGLYSLTEMAIGLVPLFAHMGAWGRRHLPVTEELSIRAELLEDGGPPLWDAFMEELRAIHLGTPMPARSVSGELRAAYEAVVARKQATSLGKKGSEPRVSPSGKPRSRSSL
ncbi:helix-turn-helix transcriptional regulator [Rhizobium sp. TRM96647]|uniref:winged helix-turn-helix transcriptional regulator n=1 Tax=unclassified Rhizobium TaxID=2613769 RepID=UPI0021E88DCF|nr:MULTISPECIES: helix-turn-helix domain-containing protein [unclassified Rhizobium]MCV3739446.1 helix-turn-helix transcriptional regulator [Rhizobium sp. TRM96647]MCV3761092.1 helix-turn-helix transcriptional regulator [Rhizobium sp. TRM96650]